MAYIVVGLVTIIMGACAIAPMLFGSMSKEDRAANGIVWKDSDEI